MKTELLSPGGWTDYELVDSGGFEKLERFGDFLLARPEPQAIWNRSLPDSEWAKAHAVFRKDRKSDERGEWILSPGMRQQWFVDYRYGEMKLRMRLGLTAFKHVGIFPEQAVNWEWIYDRVRDRGTGAKVLNLFAYTGGASLAARAAGAEVTHVDAVKQVVTWSRENMEASGLDGIRWVVEDALKFVRREVRRGKKYDGIILDPPAYGRGPEGEKWVLEEHLGELLAGCAALAEPGAFVVLNLYSMGLSALLARTAVRQSFGTPHREQFGELFVEDRSAKALPLGVYYRGLFGPFLPE
jgi:23S rRNA (cytosine1962-C5)-methyltransferase